MLDKHITFTYGELIEAFNEWNKILEQDKVPERPTGNTWGEMFTNYLITSVNKIRAEKLTSYRQ
jgi:hypothetical protein